MSRIRRARIFIPVVLALFLLMPAGSVYASLMSVTEPAIFEFDWPETSSAPVHVPAPKVPIDQNQESDLWNWNYSIDSSMGSTLNSWNTQVTDCFLVSACGFVSDQACDKLCVIDFQFVPEAKPNARDKPPKPGIDFSDLSC